MKPLILVRSIFKQIQATYAFLGIALLLSMSVMWAQNDSSNGRTLRGSPHEGTSPNILFIIMDDVGIDQMTAFGYGGVDPASTPNIDAIARAGVRFRNVWAMPECSPSRAVFFEGRYPLRTNVFGALLDDDLANSQVSPYEATTPKLLKTRGYDSGDFGKFHLGEKTHNPFHDGLVHSLGWDYFDGFLQGAPPPIDTTAGGVGNAGQYTCGFVPNLTDGGADTGSCRFVNNTCQDLTVTSAHPTPGRYCLEQGGVFVPETSCQQAPGNSFNFTTYNGYYVWPRVTNYPDGQVATVQYERGFVAEATTASAINWINAEKNANKNWMATVAFPQIHSPYQQVPQSLLAAGSPDLGNLNCSGNPANNVPADHRLSNQMLESMDTEIGRLLVQTGLATYNPDGSLNYQPQNTDTMVVLVGDNGTYGPGVKLPFNPARAKAFVYQTGVWVPLMIAGPMVSSPNRDVESMVNIADLFQLFGEIAGIDVRRAVPSSHILDSVGMLSYITNPNQHSIRQTNFTQTGNNIHLMAPLPCVISLGTTNTCAQLFTSKALCKDEGGVWYGSPDSDSPNGKSYQNCCQVKNDFPTYDILPDFQNAIRNDNFKLVQIKSPDCSQQPDPHGAFPDLTFTEFYEINQAAPIPMLDNKEAALCSDNPDNKAKLKCPRGLTSDQTTNFNSLLSNITQLLNSEAACPGDGNEDKAVNGQDIQSWRLFSEFAQGQSSWSDFNIDGFTDRADLAIIHEHLGTKCPPRK
jgi:Sulfatase